VLGGEEVRGKPLADMKEIIKAKRLTKIYGRGPNEVRALDRVDLAVKKGEFLVIMGPSGSGKTTLLNMLGALDKPTAGDVYLDGVRISEVPERGLFKVRRENVGFIFQSYYLIPTMTALENVLVPTLPISASSTRKVAKSVRSSTFRVKGFKERAEMLLAEVGLAERVCHKPSQLSGGEQQRVAIARALILDPPVILADEPTGNLDTKKGREIIGLMRRLNEERGKTFVVATHDPAIAEVADRMFEIIDGKIEIANR